MIEIKYVPVYMKINHILFVIKGQFPVTDYIPNTIILYFIVHCICIMFILLHNMFLFISYATCDEMHSFQ